MRFMDDVVQYVEDDRFAFGGACGAAVVEPLDRTYPRFCSIVIRKGANVQDCAVVHVTPAGGVEIGPGKAAREPQRQCLGIKNMLRAPDLLVCRA